MSMMNETNTGSAQGVCESCGQRCSQRAVMCRQCHSKNIRKPKEAQWADKIKRCASPIKDRHCDCSGMFLQIRPDQTQCQYCLGEKNVRTVEMMLSELRRY